MPEEELPDILPGHGPSPCPKAPPVPEGAQTHPEEAGLLALGPNHA